MTFDDKKYEVVRGFLDASTSLLMYQYCTLNVLRVDHMKQNHAGDHRPSWDGDFGDKMVRNTYARYGDPLFDSLLLATAGPLELITGYTLVPTYSYWRFYQLGDVLERHIDRHSCEISCTICMGGTGESWPIMVDAGNGSQQIDLDPGDMLVYKGCEVEHWRDAFRGHNQAQVFMHYNRADKQDNNYLDGRLMPAIPKLI
jgi:hypothetical protein